ncbi:hypothetical protein HDU86_003119 [Geranomyces michiganensis]|nr:hypothetical protein HDU86_003119 [Geranomyces michiganensis]
MLSILVILGLLCAVLVVLLASSCRQAHKQHAAAAGNSSASIHPTLNGTTEHQVDGKLIATAKQKERDIEAAAAVAATSYHRDNDDHHSEDNVDLDGRTLAESMPGGDGSGRSGSFSSFASSSPAAAHPPPPSAAPVPQPPPLSSKNIVLARAPWKGLKDDEITIRVGDPISVYEELPNGQAMGMNWALGIAGLFPLQVLANGQAIEVFSQSLSRPPAAVLSRQGTLSSRTKGDGGSGLGPPR